MDLEIPPHRAGHEVVIAFWVGDCVGSYSIDDLAVNQVAQFLPPPPPPPHGRIAHPPPPPGVVALLGFEGTDDGVTTSVTHTNGTWDVSVPDERAAHNGNQVPFLDDHAHTHSLPYVTLPSLFISHGRGRRSFF